MAALQILCHWCIEESDNDGNRAVINSLPEWAVEFVQRWTWP